MPRVIRDVFVNHEALIFRRGRILPESFVPGTKTPAHYDRLSRYGWFLIKNHWLRRGEINAPSGLWINDNYLPSYHHWMIDALPRLVRAEESHPDEHDLLLPRYYQQPYIAFTLRAFPHIERVGWIGARAKTRVERLAFVPRQTGERLLEQIAEAARRVAALVGEPGPARRVYVTREDASWRKARNEADVMRELRSHDFEIVRVDPSKPWEAVKAAMGASLIAGVHGAGLTNLIFMPPGARVLELRHGHDEIFFDAYRPLAEGLGIEYRRQSCQLADDGERFLEERPTNKLSDPERRAINMTDIVVDLDVLRENLHDAPGRVA